MTRPHRATFMLAALLAHQPALAVGRAVDGLSVRAGSSSDLPAVPSWAQNAPRAAAVVPTLSGGSTAGMTYTKVAAASEALVKSQFPVVSAMLWLGTLTAWGSMGMFAASLTPRNYEASYRTLYATMVVLAMGLPAEFLVHRLYYSSLQRFWANANDSAANVRARRMLVLRLGTLSHALQALSMGSCALLTTAMAWCGTSWGYASLSAAAIPGAVLAALGFVFGATSWHDGKALYRPPVAAHLWVPFLVCFIAAHSSAFEMLRQVHESQFNMLVSVWAVGCGFVTTGVMRLLSWQARQLQAETQGRGGPFTLNKNKQSSTRDLKEQAQGSTLQEHLANIVLKTPGLTAVAWISVIVQLGWCASALFWWSTNSINVRYGLGVVAVACNVVESCGATAADLGKKEGLPDVNGVRRLGRFMVVTFERLSMAAFVQAAWRAFWWMEPPKSCDVDLSKHECLRRDCEFEAITKSATRAGAFFEPFKSPKNIYGRCFQQAGKPKPELRLQRQFISCLMSFGAYAVAGAVRGRYSRALWAVVALISLLGRAMYITFLFNEPAAIAGLVGVVFGLSVLGITVFNPQLFEESRGTDATELMTELASLGKDMTASVTQMANTVDQQH